MNDVLRRSLVFSTFAVAIVFIGFLQSWNVALGIFNLCLISATMALGVNIQLGYAGIFNAGVMGFAALGGLSAVIISYKPVSETISLGGLGILICILILLLGSALGVIVYKSNLSQAYKKILFPLIKNFLRIIIHRSVRYTSRVIKHIGRCCHTVIITIIIIHIKHSVR